MTIKEARQNLLTVLATARIEMPDGPLTGQEHNILHESLQLLFTKAMDADEKIIEAKKESEKKEGE